MPLDFSIVIHGAAGHGLNTLESVLADIVQHAGFYVFSSSEYMSRIRGGDNSVEIRLTTFPVLAFVKRIDLLISMSPLGVEHLSHRITKNTIIIADDAIIETKYSNSGKKLFANSIVMGFVLSLLNIFSTLYLPVIKKYFSNDTLRENIQSIDYGYQLADKLCDQKQLTKYSITATPLTNFNITTGTEAIAAGALVVEIFKFYAPSSWRSMS